MALSISDLDCNVSGFGSLAVVGVSIGDIILVSLEGSGGVTSVTGSTMGSYTNLKETALFSLWGVEATTSGNETITVVYGAGGNFPEYGWIVSGAPGLPDGADVNGITGSAAFGGVGTTQHSTTIDNTGVPANEYPLMLFGAIANRTGGITMNASTSSPTWEVRVPESADYGVWASAWIPGETPEPAFDYNATTTGNGATLTGRYVWITHGAFDVAVTESSDGLSTVATIDHDLLIGVEEDQHHAKIHPLSDENQHTGGYIYKSGARVVSVSDADVLSAGITAAADGQVAVSYNTLTGQTFVWTRLNGTWAGVEVTT